MNSETAFLDAIKAAPEDSALRLVYADWLEERGSSAQSEFLRLHHELLSVIGSGDLNQSSTRKKLRRLRMKMNRLAWSIDAGWTAIFAAMQPAIFACCVCRTPLLAKDAIATNPRTQQNLKNRRYCRHCFEDAIRAQQRGGFHDYSSRSPSSDYHGKWSDDD